MALKDNLSPEEHMAIDIIETISHGTLDAHLKGLMKATKARMTELAQSTLTTYVPGKRIRFNGSVRPMYLRGMTGTIVKGPNKPVLKRMQVWVEVDDDPRARRFSGEQVRVDVGTLIRVGP